MILDSTSDDLKIEVFSDDTKIEIISDNMKSLEWFFQHFNKKSFLPMSIKERVTNII